MVEALTSTVTEGLGGLRLDQALARLQPEFSRSRWQKAIKAGQVKLNGQIQKNIAQVINVGDSIEIEISKADSPSEDAKLPIIYEHPDWLVIDKPSGLLSHAKGVETDEPTVATLLQNKIEPDGTNRAGIVHRLDRATSGLMVVAKGTEAKVKLQRLFSRRQVEKLYYALVSGVVADNKVELTWPIARNPKRPSQFKISPAGKRAQTTLVTKIRFKTVSEVELTPKTGRTHQLRVHLQAYGHPILGDDVYASAAVAKQAPRLCLHAQRLAFNYDEKNYDFSSDIPTDIVSVRSQYES